MLFNSDVFLRFFAAFLLLNYLVRRHQRARNALIVGASYLFYGWWDWRFLGLLLASSVLDYSVGLGIARSATHGRRRAWLSLSLAGNLGMLSFFKYHDFFAASLATCLGRFGLAVAPPVLHLLLPVGISFYTFQTLSYALDVYRGNVAPTRDFLSFLAYVSFFPQLVAGPIERAGHLLPQFGQVAAVTAGMVGEGVWLILWGLFKKVVLADNLAPLVELVYQHPVHSAPLVVCGTLAFGLQIYGDFSGYSDIARGLAKLLGFDIMLNFNLPYWANSPREFWRRWHISLSTWLRDYLYISLGGNRLGRWRTRLNLVVTMLLGGLWHGAAWNFVLWGGWHGLGLVVDHWWRERRGAGGGPRAEPAPVWSKGSAPASPPVLRRSSATARDHTLWDRRAGWGAPAAGWVATMVFVFYGWLLFRAGSWTQIVSLTRALSSFQSPPWFGSYLLNLGVFGLPLIAVQFWQLKTGDLLVALSLPGWALAALEAGLLFAILLFWRNGAVPFIYFQF